MQLIVLIVVGLAVGALSGIIGLAGGVFLIPILVYSGLTMRQAVGTYLAAAVLPVTLPAAWEYYRQNQVSVRTAMILAVTLTIGSWATAHYMRIVPDIWIQRIFGAALLCVSLRFLLKR